MSKLYRARSLLYRRQILQQNIRWKALDEIYKIYMLLHRSDLNISEKIVDILLISSIFSKLNLENFAFFDSRTLDLDLDRDLGTFGKFSAIF